MEAMEIPEKENAYRIDLDWSALDALLRFKVTLHFCSEYLGVSEDLIQNRIKDKFGLTFKEYREQKLDWTRHQLQKTALEKALAGNVPLTIFLLKNFCGFTDKQEITSNDNEAESVIINICERKINDEQDSQL